MKKSNQHAQASAASPRPRYFPMQNVAAQSVFFNAVTGNGHDSGIGSVCLEIESVVDTPDGEKSSFTPVVFLHGTMPALRQLRAAIDAIEELNK